jgi:hypothetical protein
MKPVSYAILNFLIALQLSSMDYLSILPDYLLFTVVDDFFNIVSELVKCLNRN